ncbi:TPA: metallophosphoesterase [Clostridioides difficile]|nr:metallophosphoesterase [Clostridioides difficile]MDV9490209.1 metallophosphoesterase [Clostridioides difficile]HCQ6326294.1 metallophosphoesterase [Clostridioides difficile]
MIIKVSMTVLVLILLYILYKYETQHIETTEYTIFNKKIPKEFDNFKIVQVSDLHNKVFDKNNKVLIDKIESLNPDVIFITGDLVDGENKNFQVALDLIDNLVEKYEVYHIIGNHEQKSLIKKYKHLYKDYFKELYSKKIINMENESVRIYRGNSHLNLYGLIIPLKCYPYLFANNKKLELSDNFVEDNLGKVNENEYNILLAHTPFFFEKYAKWGADLVLAGHVHGGIIRIPFVGGVLSPNREFFPKYDWGKYEKDNSTMILNKGLGGSKVLIRLNCKPEIVKITLKYEK